MLSVRLLVFLATAVALAPYTTHTYLDGCAFGKRVIAQVFNLGNISQDLSRLYYYHDHYYYYYYYYFYYYYYINTTTTTTTTTTTRRVHSM